MNNCPPTGCHASIEIGCRWVGCMGYRMRQQKQVFELLVTHLQKVT